MTRELLEIGRAYKDAQDQIQHLEQDLRSKDKQTEELTRLYAALMEKTEASQGSIAKKRDEIVEMVEADRQRAAAEASGVEGQPEPVDPVEGTDPNIGSRLREQRAEVDTLGWAPATGPSNPYGTPAAVAPGEVPPQPAEAPEEGAEGNAAVEANLPA